MAERHARMKVALVFLLLSLLIVGLCGFLVPWRKDCTRGFHMFRYEGSMDFFIYKAVLDTLSGRTIESTIEKWEDKCESWPCAAMQPRKYRDAHIGGLITLCIGLLFGFIAVALFFVRPSLFPRFTMFTGLIWMFCVTFYDLCYGDSDDCTRGWGWGATLLCSILVFVFGFIAFPSSWGKEMKEHMEKLKWIDIFTKVCFAIFLLGFILVPVLGMIGFWRREDGTWVRDGVVVDGTYKFWLYKVRFEPSGPWSNVEFDLADIDESETRTAMCFALSMVVLSTITRVVGLRTFFYDMMHFPVWFLVTGILGLMAPIFHAILLSFEDSKRTCWIDTYAYHRCAHPAFSIPLDVLKDDLKWGWGFVMLCLQSPLDIIAGVLLMWRWRGNLLGMKTPHAIAKKDTHAGYAAAAATQKEVLYTPSQPGSGQEMRSHGYDDYSERGYTDTYGSGYNQSYGTYGAGGHEEYIDYTDPETGETTQYFCRMEYDEAQGTMVPVEYWDDASGQWLPWE